MPIKLMSSGTGGVNLQPASTISSDVTLNVPVTGVSGGTLVASDSSGNVGIGTSSPLSKLDALNGTAGKSAFSARGISGNLYIDYNGAGNNYYEANYHLFTNSTGATEWMRIDSSGIVTGTAGNLMLVSGTAVSASGTSVTFTGIPSWVKRITVMLAGVSTNGTSLYQIQGGSGSIENTGYSSMGTRISTASVSSGATVTSGFIMSNVVAAASLFNGTYVLTNVSGNTWTFGGGMSATANEISLGYGGKTFSGTLDRIRITTVNGTDTFDAGSINILYE